MPGAARAAGKGRTGRPARAARSSSSSVRVSAAAARRWAATMRLRMLFTLRSQIVCTISAVSAQPAGTIVVVEDDRHIADLVELYLREEGFRVIQAPDGQRGLDAVRDQNPRLVILDVGLPGTIDGLEVCRRLRARDDLPVLMLTARDRAVDRVLGLELGADDYVTKPFSPRELVARVKAILRRVEGPPRDRPDVVLAGGVEIDSGRREVRVGGTVVPLATREFDRLQ